MLWCQVWQHEQLQIYSGYTPEPVLLACKERWVVSIWHCLGLGEFGKCQGGGSKGVAKGVFSSPPVAFTSFTPPPQAPGAKETDSEFRAAFVSVRHLSCSFLVSCLFE